MTARSITFSSSRTLPGQGYCDQGIHGVGWNGLDPAAHSSSNFLREMAHKPGNVVATFTKRRQHDGEHVQPIVKVAAKLAVSGHLREVAVRGRHQAHVNAHGPRAAQSLKLLLLQHTEQLGLQLRRNIAHFIEKQCPCMGELETANLLHDRAGEGTLFMAEQLAFQAARWESRRS